MVIEIRKNDGSVFGNDYPCKINIAGIVYENAEAAFQAQKTKDIRKQEELSTMDAKEAIEFGRTLDIVDNWDSIRLEVMKMVIREKFMQNEDLKKILVDTGEDPIVFVSRNEFWGNGKYDDGDNNLGHIFEDIRKELSVIDSFTGEFDFLSNMFNCEVEFDGRVYQSAMAAFQAQKTEDEDERDEFTTLNSFKAVKKGFKVDIRDDWEDVNTSIMYDILKAKFSDETLKRKLLATGNMKLVFGNTKDNDFWGMATSDGHNYLGKILMKIRMELRLFA